MNSMRAKMRFHTVIFRGDPENPETPRTYEGGAVYDDGTEENRRFNRATPWAKLEISVDNPNARLQVGKDYYVDFIPAWVEPVSETVEDHSRDVPPLQSEELPGMDTAMVSSVPAAEQAD